MQTPSPALLPLVLDHIRTGQTQQFCRCGEGHCLCTRGGQDQSSFPNHTVQPPSGSLPKVLSVNRGSLRVTSRCMDQTPLPALGFCVAASANEDQSELPRLVYQRNCCFPGMVETESPHWTESQLIPTT